jgi:alkanesulfonate monooxygenase SsuD/methylene tetrahydromethanopterin reductase-like flavin-dependent oxidoreductase (luciferase family)
VWQSHGVVYPAAAERIARLDESVALVRSLWTGAPVSHAGPSITLAGARLEPLPIQRPGPPVWIAAMGPLALRLVARRADAWEASYVTPQGFGDLWRELQRRLDDAGRAPDALARSVELDVSLAAADGDATAPVAEFCAARGIAAAHPLAATLLAGGPGDVARRLAEYAAAGATDVMLGFGDFPSTRMLEAFAREVRPRLLALSRRGPRPSTTPPAA